MKTTEAPIEMNEMRENNLNNEDIIEPLMEPIVTIPSERLIEQNSTVIKRFSGIIYALISAFLITISIFITKQLQVDLLHALIPRFFLQTIILFIFIKFVKHYTFYHNATKHELFLLFVNAFFATTGVFSFFIGYRYIPLSDLTTIRYTQVIWTAILTAIIYSERPSIPIIIAILLTTIGVTLVGQADFIYNKIFALQTKSDPNDQRVLGLLIALYSSIAMSIMIISNKDLLIKFKTKHSLIIIQFTFLSFCVTIAYYLYNYSLGITDIKSDFFNLKYFISSTVCLLQILSSILAQKAVKREHPSIFTIVQSSDILFSILLQNIFTSTRTNFVSLCGSILVLISILIISAFKLIEERRKKQMTNNI